MRSFLLYIYILGFLIFPRIAFSQYVEIGAAVGVMTYTGEFSSRIDPYNISPGTQVFLRHNLSPVFVLRYNFLYGNIKGNDLNSSDPYQSEFRKLEFSQNIFEGSFLMEYNFFDYRNPKLKYKREISPYLFGGFGFVKMQPRTKTDGSTAAGVQPMIPIGFGVKYARPSGWNFGLEFGARKTFTDYLDGLSDTEDSKNVQLGIPDDKDWYYFGGFYISYTFLGISCKTPFYY